MKTCPTTSFPAWALLLSVLLFANSCEKPDPRTDSAWWTLEAERIAVENQVKLGRLRLAQWEEQSSTYDAIMDRHEEAGLRHSELKAQLAMLEESVPAMASANEAWREERLSSIRKQREGEILESISSLSGRTFHDIEVTSVSEAGVEFKHPTGRARLTAGDLSIPQLHYFGIDPHRSREVVSAEHHRARLYAEEVERTLQVVRAEKEKDRLEAQSEREIRTLQAQLARSKRELSRAEDRSALAASPRQLGSGRRSRSRWSSTVYPNYYHYPTSFYSCVSGSKLYSIETRKVYPNTPNGRLSAGRSLVLPSNFYNARPRPWGTGSSVPFNPPSPIRY